MLQRKTLIVVVVAVIAAVFAFAGAAECPTPTHQSFSWLKTSIDRHKAIKITIPVKATLRASVSGCVTNKATQEPLGNVEFRVIKVVGELPRGIPPTRLQIDSFGNKDAPLKEVEEIRETTSSDGQLTVEGLSAGKYALVPEWPSDPDLEFIAVDFDISITGDVGVPLQRMSSIDHPTSSD